MANEFAPNVDRHPSTGGTFWLMTDRRTGEWSYTLRAKGASSSSMGMEVARFNAYVGSKHPGLFKTIVDTLNALAEVSCDLELLIDAHRHGHFADDMLDHPSPDCRSPIKPVREALRRVLDVLPLPVTEQKMADQAAAVWRSRVERPKL